MENVSKKDKSLSEVFSSEIVSNAVENTNLIKYKMDNNIVIISSSPKLDAVKVIKKDGTVGSYNVKKVVNAVKKSAERMLIKFSDADIEKICSLVNKRVLELGSEEIYVSQMHNIVESVLEDVNPKVAKSYRDYRNYKIDFVQMLDKVYQESQKIMYIGDKENSNADSTLVSTKRSLIFNQLNKELYKKFFLNVEELQAIRDGYIYIHDMSARRDTMNCCLFDIANVLKGGLSVLLLMLSEMLLWRRQDSNMAVLLCQKLIKFLPRMQRSLIKFITKNMYVLVSRLKKPEKKR